MTITYTIHTLDNQTSICKWIDGNHYGSIPPDPANRDYQEYLEWVAEGNTAEPAE
tara:strand:- start:409 stop:573 length:165 start_codon:yes stop_codon:yes gene_type:complete